MKNLFAHTEAGHDYPAYISINKDADGSHRISVRSAGNGGRDLGEIHVTPEVLRAMVDEINSKIEANQAQEVAYRKMVDRFLGWKLPQDFVPDAGIQFMPAPYTQYDGPHWPTGTNLLTADQALEMFKHCIDLPIGPVLHAPSGAVFDEVIAAVEPADLVALTPQDEHQCCGKCEKPLAERVADNFAATMEQSMRTGPEPTHYSGLGGAPAETVTETVSVEGYESRPEVLRAVIEDLAQRLHQADVVITALVLQAGGVVTISGEDADKVVGHRIECEAVYGSGGDFTFRAVPVPQPTQQ